MSAVSMPIPMIRAMERTIVGGPFSAGAAVSLRRRSCSMSLICSRTMRNRIISRRSSARVFFGQRRPFRGAKTVEPFLGLAQRRLKGADPEARQHCLHPVHEARTVADELFVLAARPLGIFVLDRRNRRHAAVALLAPQPTEEGAHQQLRVQTIGLCPSVPARDSDARGMGDIGLDAAPPQPARQPKAVAS